MKRNIKLRTDMEIPTWEELVDYYHCPCGLCDPVPQHFEYHRPVPVVADTFHPVTVVGWMHYHYRYGDDEPFVVCTVPSSEPYGYVAYPTSAHWLD